MCIYKPEFALARVWCKEKPLGEQKLYQSAKTLRTQTNVTPKNFVFLKIKYTDLAIWGNQFLKSCDLVTYFLASPYWHPQLQEKKKSCKPGNLKNNNLTVTNYIYTLCSVDALMTWWWCHCSSQDVFTFFFLLIFLHTFKDVLLLTRSLIPSCGSKPFCRDWKSWRKVPH